MESSTRLPDDDELITDVILGTETKTPPSRWAKARLTGDGPPYLKIGHLVRYRRGDVRAWLESHRRLHSTSEMEVA